MIKHKYVNRVKKYGLFKGVNSFSDIQKQINNHSEEPKDRGDAFEVFAEAYLRLGINLPYKAVYPENKLTAKHFKRLKIASSDTNVKGIDGALETQSDEFHTYQVKYRSSGDSLSWNDLTGSVVASQNADALLIFTNVSDIDGDIAQRNVYSIRHDKLNDLTKDDLKRIEILIYKDQVKKKRAIKLDPYQKDAISDVLKKLKTDDRTQLIMPCGSGKTIVGQRIIESIDDAKTILVLVPTLQLLNDTFENYFNDTRWDSFPFMCVGSKVVDSYAYDQMDADPSEMPMVTRTDTELVKAFLKKKFNRHIIFSTYQSLPVVADALRKRKVDVAIFDEAHNTASKKGNVWTFGLDNKNIKIKKRIFMTATPRKYQLRRKNEENMRVVFSMDDSKVYGDIAYKLSFKKAADEYGAICRYKIIISVITSKYYTRKDLRDGDVLIGYSDVNAENIAKQIALQDAVKNNTIKKIISFHPTIAHSESFVGEKEISVKHRLKDFDLYNVSSKKKMGIRRSTMSEFRKADTALISNAQCLNEGVDVPAVDMVAFIAPKKSKVSIVQAVGRAIRKPRGSNKEWGYVFVPIFLEKEKGETDIEAAERSKFKDVYEVINALRDHDEVLDEIIQNIRIDKGYKGKFNGEALADYIQINGIDLSIDNLEKYIQSEIVEKTSSNWLETFGMGLRYLEKYIDKEKNSWVPRHMKIGDFKFGSWVSTRRDSYKHLKNNRKDLITVHLTQNQINRFESIDGWVWDVDQEKLEIVLEVLIELKMQNDDYSINHTILNTIPSKRGSKAKLFHRKLEIGAYVSRIKRNYLELKRLEFDFNKMPRGYKITQNQIDGFNSLPDWNWERKYDGLWHKHFQEYKIFTKTEKTFRVLNKPHSKKYPGLFRWQSKTRSDYKTGNLTNEQIKLLTKAGFVFNPNADKDKKYRGLILELKNFYKENGHFNIPQKPYSDLGSFVQGLRNTHRAIYFNKPGKQRGFSLTKERIAELDSMGFTWDVHKDRWITMYNRLKMHKDEFGHLFLRLSKVSRNKKYKGLSRWISRQKEDKRIGLLDNKQWKEDLLNEIGFPWGDLDEELWNFQFKIFLERCDKIGINKISQTDKVVGAWVSSQRTKFKAGSLDKEKIKLLVESGFDFEPKSV